MTTLAIAKSKKKPVGCPRLDAERIADRLNTVMQCFGWSCADLARKTGISYATLHAYVEGRRVPVVENCVVLTVALNFPSIDHLLFGRPKAEWNLLRE
jgi:hypothetical protein